MTFTEADYMLGVRRAGEIQYNRSVAAARAILSDVLDLDRATLSPDAQVLALRVREVMDALARSRV